MSELIRSLKEKIEHLVDMDRSADNGMMTQIRAEKIDLYENVIKELSASQAREAELREKLEFMTSDRDSESRWASEYKQRAEAAEAKLKEISEATVVAYNACHAELVEIMRILHCVAEAPPPSMEQTVVVRGMCELTDRVRKADDRVRVLTDALSNFSWLKHGVDWNKGTHAGFHRKKTEQFLQNEFDAIINATPQQTAEQIERWHVEWMKTLRPAQWFIDVTTNDSSTGRYEVAAEDCRDDAIPLYAIPPLPKE